MPTIRPANHITLSNSFAQEAIEELPAFLQDKTQLTDLVTWAANRWEGLDDETVELAYARLLDNASGILLDNIGNSVGIPRLDKTDDEYESVIRLRTVRQISGTDRDTVMGIISKLLLDRDYLFYKGINNFIELIVTPTCLESSTLGEEIDKLLPINANLWVHTMIDDPFVFFDGKDGIQPADTGNLRDEKLGALDGTLVRWEYASTKQII